MPNADTRPPRRTLANAIRALSMDAVEAAKSGHPGAPLGLADLAEVLWNDFLRHNPGNPRWFDRDRFVLSNGHASALLYSLLHLSGYELPIEELRNFRQLHSRTPGHPEYGLTPGVETTTGPLGQGLANAVGMALAERLLAAQYNRDDLELVDHYTYVIAGDGCLMEGVSHEACSLAGTLGLGKLIVLYDDNRISIDGEVSGWFADDTAARFEAYGWHVIRGVDGHDPDAVAPAIAAARSETRRPSLVCCRTVIGWGAPGKQGTAKVHGDPLGAAEVERTRARIGWAPPPFEIPADVRAAWDGRARGAESEQAWRDKFDRYRQRHPQLAAEFERRMRGDLGAQWRPALDAHIAGLLAKPQKLATRVASKQALDALVPALPELVGGSADLTGSNGTLSDASRAIRPGDGAGNYVHYGVREFAMTAMMNGMALHGGFVPYGGTFLVFSDYARNAVRMAALMELRTVLVYTHDSIGLGQDGPTHQAVEHTASLRLMPNLDVWRPADAVETAVAWQCALERMHGPSALLLTRQGVPQIPGHGPASLAGIARGAYIVLEPAGRPEAIVIATGSEVELALAAARALNDRGRRVRVVSMPCAEAFARQDAAWRDAILPPEVQARVAVEAGATDTWYRYVGSHGRVVGLDRFGLSAPAEVLFNEFGFTADNIARAVEESLAAAPRPQ